MVVPERYLKARKATQTRLAQRADLIKKQEERNAAINAHAMKVAEQYAAEYKKAEEEKKAFLEAAAKKGELIVPAEPKLLLVVRLRGLKKCSPKTRAILNVLRLRQVNNAVFVRCNKATLNALRLVEPYVTYGEPTLDTIRKLCYKRGYAKVNSQRLPIVDNTLIDEVLSKQNIRCIEDLVHEIYTVGSHFKEANNFLWPFKLAPTELKAKRRHFVEGGDHGNRGKYINDLVAKMI